MPTHATSTQKGDKMIILLEFPDETRDITDIYDSYVEGPGFVNVVYTHWIVNGKKIPGKHCVKHYNAHIQIKEEEK